MSNKSIDVDEIIGRIINENAKQFALFGTPAITKNTIEISLGKFKFQTLSPLTKPLSINHFAYENDTDKSTEASFPKKTVKTVSTFAYSFSEGFKYSNKSSLEVGIPGIGNASGEVSIELDFSATQTQTNSKEETWTYDVPIPVPARSKICADLVIDHNKFDSNFTGEIILKGDIELKATSVKGGQTTLLVSIPSWLSDNKDSYSDIKFSGSVDFNGVKVPEFAVIQVSGVFTGVSGTNSRVEVKQIAVGDNCKNKNRANIS